MTVSHPPAGTTAPRPQTPSRARRTAPAALLATVLLLITGLLAVPSASASTATPTPTPTSAVAPGEAVFTLSPIANGIVRPGDGLAVSVTLQNGTDAATPATAVTLSLGSEALTGRAALSAWLNGEGSSSGLAAVGQAALPAVAPAGTETAGIVVAPTDPSLAARAPGVYPLSASYDLGDGPVSSRSVMIVPPDAAAEVGIGVIVPITAAATAEGLLTATELAALTAAEGSLTDQLDAVDGTAAILAVDPAIPAAIQVLGSAAPATATAWLARLDALPNSRFALQFGDADVAAQMQAGLSRPLRPLSLQSYMVPADFTASTGATPSPSPTAESGEPVYPTLPELLDIGGARESVFWPGTGTTTPAVVQSLGAVTIDGRDSLTLVPSTATVAGASGGTVPGRAISGDADLLVYDADVSRELRAASDEEETSLRGAPLTAAAAYLAFATAQSGGEPIVVTLDRGEDRSRVALRTAITSASQAPGVTPLTLGGVAARIPASVEIADGPVDQVRVDAAAALVADEAQVNRFSTILDDPTVLTGPERAEILQLLGLAWVPEPEEWTTALAGHRAATATTLDSVGILPPSDINLFSAGAPIPIWVRNDLDYPVNVVLFATPDDLRLDVTRANEVTAGANSNTRVQVPVQARVGNGEVSVQLQLRSRTLEPIGDAQVVDVNVRADWEGIGLVILSVLVGGFLLLGVVRTVLRFRRRSRRAAETPDAASAETDHDKGTG